MALSKWTNTKIKKLEWTDIKLIKLSTAAFILMLAKLWQPLLSLEWYWYGLIFIIAAIKPFKKIYVKK